jgi:molybdenum cofactor synthesis domain-containing protein
MATEAASVTTERRSGGLVVIGDEVLGRRVDESNTARVLDAFARHGIRAREVAIVPDEEARIAAVVRDFATRFDLVITTGGVGPTHDDCTWRAVAAALDDTVVLRQDVLTFLSSKARTPLTPEQERMAWLPSRTEIEFAPGGGWALHLANVWVLPGVPSMVSSKIDAICSRYAGPVPTLVEAMFSIDEWDVVAMIDKVVASHPELAIGSYPLFDPALDHKLRISLEGPDRASVEAGLQTLIARLGANVLVRTHWR